MLHTSLKFPFLVMNPVKVSKGPSGPITAPLHTIINLNFISVSYLRLYDDRFVSIVFHPKCANIREGQQFEMSPLLHFKTSEEKLLP